MTVVAWDGKTLAADRCATIGHHRATVTKVVRWETADGIYLGGGAGCLPLLLQMHVWLQGGGVPAQFPAGQKTENDWVEYLLIRPDKTVVRYEDKPVAIPVEEDFFAMGTGRGCALGAMAMGATAYRAVEIANIYADGCGGGIDFFRYGE